MFIASSEAWTVQPHTADSKPGKELKRQREIRIFTCGKRFLHQGLYEVFTVPKHPPFLIL